MANDYLDRLQQELEASGVVPQSNKNNLQVQNVNIADDNNLRTILEMQQITGTKYSDEQRAILDTKGNTCILASAGSGKTTISTHLIAKRIKTGEIQNVDRLIYTTYSKAGQLEMKDRLDKLLDQLGIQKKVEVRTLHSFFLQVLRTFGVTAEIIKDKMRNKFISEACKDAEVDIKDDDLMLIDNLLSYQVNNLLNDKKTIESYVNTLEDLTLEQYSKIRSGYATKKADKGLIDYDDMQSYLYLWLVKFARSNKQEERQIAESVRNYCKAMWTDFYIDEAQDVSKIQFAIVRAIVTDPNDKNRLTAGLVFIGDDDQCLIEGTTVLTERGYRRIEDIADHDYISTAVGKGKVASGITDHVSKRYTEEDIVVVKTKSGKEIRATYNHIGFCRIDIGDYPGVHHLCLVFIKREGYYLIVLDDDELEDRHFSKIWIIKSYSKYKNAAYQCNYYAYYYGIPRNTTDDDNMEIDDRPELLQKALGVDIKVKEFFKHLGMMEKYPHVDNTTDFNCTTEYDEDEDEDYDDPNDTGVMFTKDGKYYPINFGNLLVGMHIPVHSNGKILDDKIVSIERVEYRGNVYDISVPLTRNFIANDIVVHNCIYTWRGSDPSIILTIGPTFNMKTNQLTTNYRCLSEIVDYAVKGIKCNGNRYEKTMKASAEGGSVKIAISDKKDLCSLSIIALNHIKYWVANGEQLKDIAVLCRNNFHLALLNNMLLREGIYCNMTEDMKLTKSYMYQDIKMLIDMMEPNWNYELTQKVMWKLCRFMGAGNAKAIADFQNNCGLILSDALGYIVKHFINRNIEFNKKLNINLQAEQKIQYFIQTKLSTETKNDIYTVYQALSTIDKAEGLRVLMFQYIEASKFLYKTQDKMRSILGLKTYISNLLMKDGFDKMKEFLRVTEQLESGKMVIPGEKMTLTTVHSAKGREWKNVIMFASDNISEPSFDGIVKMLEDDISVHDISEHISEERRLFYVGNTRAKENLVTITYNEPSVFILEALGILDNKNNNANANIISFAENKDWFIGTPLQSEFNKVVLDPTSKYYYDYSLYTPVKS